ITLDLQPGEVLGIVGESGSGKSTLAKAMTGLNRFDGLIEFDGKPVRGLSDMDRGYRRDVQIIFHVPVPHRILYAGKCEWSWQL
uniref:ATP-binding cassette domain-containing protein n=1 Tax=Falsirhodobacter sp. alg1 TaxID=1472418 RepID=UPI0005F094F5